MKQHSQGSIDYQPNDWISSGILHHLLTEPKTTTELKNALGCDGTDQIRYRVREHLEPENIVEVSRGEPSHETQIPPLKVSLTNEGRDWAETLDLDYDGSRETVSSRLEYLESQVQKQDQKIEALQAECERLRRIVGVGIEDQHNPDVLALRAGYAGVASVLNDSVLDDDVALWDWVPKHAADEYHELKRGND